MLTVSTIDPQLEKFAKHYEVALNRYFEEHPEMVEEVERLTAEMIVAYWREMVANAPPIYMSHCGNPNDWDFDAVE